MSNTSDGDNPAPDQGGNDKSKPKRLSLRPKNRPTRPPIPGSAPAEPTQPTPQKPVQEKPAEEKTAEPSRKSLSVREKRMMRMRKSQQKESPAEEGSSLEESKIIEEPLTPPTPIALKPKSDPQAESPPPESSAPPVEAKTEDTSETTHKPHKPQLKMPLKPKMEEPSQEEAKGEKEEPAQDPDGKPESSAEITATEQTPKAAEQETAAPKKIGLKVMPKPGSKTKEPTEPKAREEGKPVAGKQAGAEPKKATKGKKLKKPAKDAKAIAPPKIQVDASQNKKKTSPLLAIAALLIVGLGGGAYYYFFLVDSSPSQPPVAQVNRPERPAPQPQEEKQPDHGFVVTKPAEQTDRETSARSSLEEFLAAFEPSLLHTPAGPALLVDNVIYPANAVIDPELGLSLQSVDPESNVAMLRDRTGNTFEVSL